MNAKQAVAIYRDGRHYDALNSFLVADVPFYLEEARRAAGITNSHPPAKGAGGMGHPVLELACGTGRLTIPIARSGVEIVALDLSPSMLAHAHTKAKAAGVAIDFIEGDCRSFELGRNFALIFMAFNSMQHLHDYTSLAALFTNVRKHLAEDERFVFTCSIRRSKFWLALRRTGGSSANTRTLTVGHDFVRVQHDLRRRRAGEPHTVLLRAARCERRTDRSARGRATVAQFLPAGVGSAGAVAGV